MSFSNPTNNLQLHVQVYTDWARGPLKLTDMGLVWLLYLFLQDL